MRVLLDERCPDSWPRISLAMPCGRYLRKGGPDAIEDLPRDRLPSSVKVEILP